MQYHSVPNNTIQYHVIYHSVLCNAIQYHAILFNTIQYHAVLTTTHMQYHSVPCNTIQYYTIPCSIDYHAHVSAWPYHLTPPLAIGPTSRNWMVCRIQRELELNWHWIQETHWTKTLKMRGISKKCQIPIFSIVFLGEKILNLKKKQFKISYR